MKGFLESRVIPQFEEGNRSAQAALGGHDFERGAVGVAEQYERTARFRDDAAPSSVAMAASPRLSAG